MHFTNRIENESFTSKVIRDAVTSPDGRFLIFNALGYIWSKELPNGSPKRLTSGTDFEFEPVLSPDGNSIVFVSWNDLEKGAILKIPLTGGTPTKLTSEKGIYRTPSYSPDGSKIVFRRENGNLQQGFSHTKEPGIYTMNANGSNVTKVINKGQYPVFSKDGKRIFMQDGGKFFGNLTKKLLSVNLNGKDEIEHVSSKYGNRLVLSPDNNWIAFSNLHKVYVAAMPNHGKSLELGPKSKSVPVQQVAKDAGVNIHWSRDSKKVMWTLRR